MTTFLQKGSSSNRIFEPYKDEERIHFISEHLKEIEKKNPSATNSLANYYRFAEKNYEMAKKYFKMGIELNYPNSITCLADYYFETENNPDEAIKTLKIGIENKIPECMMRLAQYYCDSNDYDSMIKFYMMAFENGHTMAIHQLALFYKYDKKDFDKMIECFNLGIEKGHSECMYGMGVYYEDVEKNYNEMKKYYMMAIENKNTRAMFALGYFYEREEHKQDLANTLYVMGAELNNEQCILGLALYYKSIGDIETMIGCYKKLTLFNNTEAFYELARYYLYKEKNIDYANRFVQEANRLGYDKDLIQKLIKSIIIMKNELEEKNHIELINFVIKTDEDSINHASEENILGLTSFEKGNFDKAKEHWINSINFGSLDGLYNLGIKYYLDKKFNSKMFKICLKIAALQYNHEKSIKSLLEYYSKIEYNRIQSIRFIGKLLGSNSIITYNDMTNNPYLFDPVDKISNYLFDKNNNLIQINLETGLKFKYEFDDSNNSNDSYTKYSLIENTL